MELNEKQLEMCTASRWDFSDLRANFLNCTLETETALRIGTPIVVLIWNDGKYGLIEWHQNRKFGRSSHIDFSNPDFVKYAES